MCAFVCGWGDLKIEDIRVLYLILNTQKFQFRNDTANSLSTKAGFTYAKYARKLRMKGRNKLNLQFPMQ